MGGFNKGGSSTVLTDLQVDGTTVTVDASNNRLGLGTASPGTQVQVEGSAPYITLKNDTAENTDGGCESRIIFEDHANVALAQIQGSHDGSSNDTKGDLIFSTHDGSSLDEALRIDSAQLATFAAAATVTTDLTVGGDIVLDDGGSLKEAGGVAAFTFDGSGNVTKIGQDTHTSGHYLKFDGSKFVLDASSGGEADAIAADNINAGDAAVNITTTAGGITLKTQQADQDIILSGSDAGAGIEALKLDMSEAGAATFNSTVTATGFTIGSAAITETELEILDGASVTTDELNLIDGDTSRGTTTVAHGDGFLHNDAGTMRMTNVSKLAELLAGTGLTATNSIIAVDAAQAITSVSADFTVTGGDVTVGAAGNTTATTISTVTNTGTNAGKALTISAGSSTTNGNNINGGNLVLKSGGGDGTGTSEVQVWTKTNGTDAATQKLTVEATGDVASLIDGAAFKFGAGGDVTLTHVHDTGLLLNSSRQLQLGDSATHIKQVSDSNLEVEADGSIILDSPVVDFEDDGVILKFGDDSEITLTHVHNTGLTLESAAASTPVFEIKNTNNGGTAGILKFNNTENGQDGADDDDLGSVTFWGVDDGTPTAQQYAGILAEIHDATSDEESGRLTLQVASHDGGVENGLILVGGSVDAEVDVTVGLGSASVVSVPGHIDLAGDIDVDGTANLDNTDIDGTLTMDGSSFSLDSTDNSNMTMTANAAGAKTLTIAAANSHGSGAGNIDIDADGTIDIDAAATISIDSTAASITLGAALADGETLKLGKNGAVETIIAPHGTAGSELYSVINTSGDTDGADAAGAILLSAVAGGIGLAWADDKDLWAEGGRAVVTANENAAAAIKLHADAGSSQTIQIINDEGTDDGAEAEGAILIEAGAGGIGLHGADDKKIWAEAGEVVVTANNNGAAAIKLHADAGANQTIQLLNDAGTGAAAIDLTSTAGGITFNSDATTAVDAVTIDASQTTKNALKVNGTAITTGHAISVDVNSLTSGQSLFIDHDDTATGVVAPLSMYLDFDKTGVTGDGIFSAYTGSFISMLDGATNHVNATVTMTGQKIDVSTTTNNDATLTNTGLDVSVAGADNNYAALFRTGNVGVGSESPSFKLTVVDNNASTPALGVYNVGNNANRMAAFLAAGSNSPSSDGDCVWLVLADGDSDGSNGVISKLQFLASGAGANLVSASDRRIKTDIAPTKVDALEIINNIPLSEFRVARKNRPVSGLNRIGFVAQDCEVAWPEMVSEIEDGDYDHKIKSIAPSTLIPVLVKAIQELSAEIKELKGG